MLALLAALLIIGGVIAAVLATSAGNNTPEAPPPAATSEPAAPAPSTEPSTAPSTTPEPTPEPTPSATPEPTTGAPAAVDAVTFVQNYYGLLPGNTDAAYAMLSPGAQSASGGRAFYDEFYAGMNSVAVEDVRAVDATTVDATVVFDQRGGATTREPYRFVVSADSGTPVIESFSRL